MYWNSALVTVPSAILVASIPVASSALATPASFIVIAPEEAAKLSELKLAAPFALQMYLHLGLL